MSLATKRSLACDCNNTYIWLHMILSLVISVWRSKHKHHFIAWHYYCFENCIVYFYFLLNLYYLQVFIIVIWVKTSTSGPLKSLKAYLDDKIDKLASSENISGIKTPVQEQSNLIPRLTKTAGGVSHWMWKLIGSLQNSVFSTSRKMWGFRTIWKEALSKNLRCRWRWFWNLRWCVWEMQRII